MLDHQLPIILTLATLAILATLTAFPTISLGQDTGRIPPDRSHGPYSRQETACSIPHTEHYSYVSTSTSLPGPEGTF